MPVAPYFWCNSVFQADPAGLAASSMIVIWTKINACIITSHTADVLWGSRRRQSDGPMGSLWLSAGRGLMSAARADWCASLRERSHRPEPLRGLEGWKKTKKQSGDVFTHGSVNHIMQGSKAHPSIEEVTAWSTLYISHSPEPQWRKGLSLCHGQLLHPSNVERESERER